MFYIDTSSLFLSLQRQFLYFFANYLDKDSEDCMFSEAYQPEVPTLEFVLVRAVGWN